MTKRFVGEANPMAVAKFKDLMKGSDGEALGAAANSIHTKLLDKKTRQNLSIILPDIIKRITCDLKKWEFDVEFTNGTNKHCFFYE